MKIYHLNELIEALVTKTPLNKVLISQDKRDKKVGKIKRLCVKNHVVYQLVPQQVINRKVGAKNQGVFADVSPIRFCTLQEVLAYRGLDIILILDGINDPGNMGAIIRTATAVEVNGIIISQRHSAPINETVLTASAGTLLRARIVNCKNLAQQIEILKQHDYWIIASDAREGKEYDQYDFSGKIGLIVGSEGKGISPLLKKRSDQLLHIPHARTVESLNVSTSTAVLLFEIRRQKARQMST